MTRRSPITVVVLSFVTFSLYAYYWLFVTTQELAEETGRPDLSPALDVLLTAATCGLWGMYATYRNARIANEELGLAGVTRDDKSLVVAIFNAATFVSGWAWLVSVAVLQEEFNALADEVTSAPRALPTDAIPMPAAF